jgi:CrcB protein
MGFHAWFAVFSGAGLGAVLRWQPGLLLNLLFPTVPRGTLAANLFGGYLIGVTVVFF